MSQRLPVPSPYVTVLTFEAHLHPHSALASLSRASPGVFLTWSDSTHLTATHGSVLTPPDFSVLRFRSELLLPPKPAHSAPRLLQWSTTLVLHPVRGPEAAATSVRLEIRAATPAPLPPAPRGMFEYDPPLHEKVAEAPVVSLRQVLGMSEGVGNGHALDEVETDEGVRTIRVGPGSVVTAVPLFPPRKHNSPLDAVKSWVTLDFDSQAETRDDQQGTIWVTAENLPLRRHVSGLSPRNLMPFAATASSMIVFKIGFLSGEEALYFRVMREVPKLCPSQGRARFSPVYTSEIKPKCGVWSPARLPEVIFTPAQGAAGRKVQVVIWRGNPGRAGDPSVDPALDPAVELAEELSEGGGPSDQPNGTNRMMPSRRRQKRPRKLLQAPLAAAEFQLPQVLSLTTPCDCRVRNFPAASSVREESMISLKLAKRRAATSAEPGSLKARLIRANKVVDPQGDFMEVKLAWSYSSLAGNLKI